MFVEEGSTSAILEAVERLDPGPGETVMMLVGEEDGPDFGALIEELNRRSISFFGGLFPGVLSGDRHSASGAVLRTLPVQSPPHLFECMKGAPEQMDEALNPSLASGLKQTAIVLVDGLATDISPFLQEMFSRLGDQLHYFGGGAGSLTLEQRPCVFTPAGIFESAAVVALVDCASRLGVRHGWQRLRGPVVATRTQGNRIFELNWKNAFEVYQQAIEDDAGRSLTPDNFFDIAKAYPFGIYKEGAEDVVRDPIAVGEDGELICVGEVPENTVLNILKGDPESLVAAAGQAVEDCVRDAPSDVHAALVADCISRVLFLEDAFGEELSTVRAGVERLGDGVVPEGALTLGEISSYGEGVIEFFNKTIVTGVLHA